MWVYINTYLILCIKYDEIPTYIMILLIILKNNDDDTILLLFHLINNNLIALVNWSKSILNNIQLYV